MVAQSAFASQNIQNISFSDFWKLGCRKIARSYGAKDIFKSKSKKYTILEPFFELQIKGKIACHCGTKRIYKSKFTKHIIPGPLFEVGMSKNSTGHFWKMGCRKIARHCGGKRFCKSKCTKDQCFEYFSRFRCRKGIGQKR